MKQLPNYPASQDNLNQLYRLYAGNPVGKEWCDFCWSDAEIEGITKPPVRNIPAWLAMKLLHETGDHFESIEVYKHYLPRILEALLPPEPEEDLYPLHLFETLKYMQFHSWPPEEQELILSILEKVSVQEYFDMTEDMLEWQQGMAFLRKEDTLPSQ